MLLFLQLKTKQNKTEPKLPQKNPNKQNQNQTTKTSELFHGIYVTGITTQY